MRWIRLEGRSAYAEVHALQERLVESVRAGGPEVVLLLEHAPTITLGRARGAAGSVLVPGEVPVVAVERGGDATWHGPGQLVAYPILRLEGARQDLHDHLRRLEVAGVSLLAGLGVSSGRDPRNTGVWIGEGEGAQKVMSIGVAVRGWVTWHGLALNVDLDLGDFARLRPCGMAADVMTRLADHLHPCPTVDALVRPLAEALSVALERPLPGTIERVSAASLDGTGSPPVLH